jgi:hypothetical protein
MEDDELIINISNITSTITIPATANVGDIWLDSNSISTFNGNDWITLTDDNNINISSIDIDSLTFPMPKEWEHEFPPFHKVEEMCKEYPGLEKAYENFKTVYTMVEQDWHGKQKEQDK